MIQLKLTSLYSTHFDVNVGPDDPTRFCEWLSVVVEGADGPRLYEEEVSVGVCSTMWMTDEVERSKGKWGHGYLIVSRWNLDFIRARVSQLCEASAAEEWEAVMRSLARYMKADVIDLASPDA